MMLESFRNFYTDVCVRKAKFTKKIRMLSFSRSSDTIERISRAFAQANTRRIELRKRYSSERDLYILFFGTAMYTHPHSGNFRRTNPAVIVL